jgi:predicted kinase
VPETARLPDDAYSPGAGKAVYRRLAADAAATLAAGCSVVVDAVFARPEERRAIADLAKPAGAPFQGIWLTADLETLEARIGTRSGDASDATAAIARQQVERGAGPIDWTIVEAGGSPERSLAAAAASIGV